MRRFHSQGQNSMNIQFSADICLTSCYIETPNWEFTLCSRAYADEVLCSWDAGLIAYDLEVNSARGWQRSLRLSFVAAFLVRR
ncbi:hypothetical protein SAMN05660710_00078 [Paracoccus tibetensis]|uniref:Uncharacterized protein n=2 Tax=Paracoccus tibetensis TaxID=336292 RepID=A0A1G5BBY3_9RHOB|nr:hypothetical protein SAMN05660710_00078 [Paracoccus tibetensis]